MILREWRGRVPQVKTEAYLHFLRTQALPDYARTPGHHGTWIVVDRGDGVSEFVLLTLWDSREAIRAFAGDDIRIARYYPEDPGFLLEMPAHVRHYDVEDMPSDAAREPRLPIQPSP